MTYNTIQYAQKKNEQLSTKLYINPPVFVKTSLYSAMWSYGVRLGTVCTVENISMQREIWLIKVITKLPNSEQSYKGKVKTHNYINRQNQSTTGKLWKP